MDKGNHYGVEFLPLGPFCLVWLDFARISFQAAIGCFVLQTSVPVWGFRSLIRVVQLWPWDALATDVGMLNAGYLAIFFVFHLVGLFSSSSPRTVCVPGVLVVGHASCCPSWTVCLQKLVNGGGSCSETRAGKTSPILGLCSASWSYLGKRCYFQHARKVSKTIKEPRKKVLDSLTLG